MLTLHFAWKSDCPENADILLKFYCLWVESANIKYKNFKPKERAALAHVFMACILEVYLNSDPQTTLMQTCSFRC